MDMILRGAAIYAAVWFIFRLSGRRTMAQMTTFDFVLLLICGEATQQGLLGDDFSITNAAFVVLTDRLRKTFKARSDHDGRDLVNSIFGNNGLAAPHMEQGDRESMRALLDGLYGVHRNKYAHRDATVEWYEAEATLSMVNWTLMWLQKNPPKPPKFPKPLL